MLFNRAAAWLFLAGIVAVNGDPVPLEGFDPSNTGLTHSDGTAAKISPDESVLYLTSDDGTVLAYDPSNGSELWRNKVDGAASCKSGVSFSPDGTKFVIAVSDTTGGTSWVVVYAHDPDEGTPLWISDEISGTPSGVPVFGSDNESLYLTYNSGGEGAFSVFSIAANTTATYSEGFAELKLESTIADSAFAGENTEWSPVGISRNPTPGGNYREGDNNQNDVVVWAHSALSDYSNIDSFSYVYQKPRFSTISSTEKVNILAGVKWSTWTAPIFTSDGQNMCFAVSKGALRCWTGGKQFQLGSNVKSNPTRDGPNPVTCVPVLSPDEKRAFFATNKKEFWGVDLAPDKSNENRTLWQANGLDEVPNTSAIITPDGETIIIITQSGRAHAIDASDGSYLWIYPAPGQTPPETVSADASLSSDGTKLWFVGTSGTLFAWIIGPAVKETSPTLAPAGTGSTPAPADTEPTVPSSEPPAPSPVAMTSPTAPAEAPVTDTMPTSAQEPTSPTAPPAEFSQSSSATSSSLSKFICLASAAVAWNMSAMPERFFGVLG